MSALDQTLLQPFRDWKTPIDALKSTPAWRDVITERGDHFSVTRLWRWTRGKDPALLAMPGTGRRLWNAAALMLTPAGRQLLAELPSPEQAPSMWLGGHEVYGPDSWAIDADGRFTRLPRNRRTGRRSS
jgi:hypothetical protein